MAKHHYYAYIRHKNGFRIDAGQMQRFPKECKIKRGPAYDNLDDWYSDLFRTFYHLHSKEQNIIIYIHGLWADIPSFYEDCEYHIHHDIFDHCPDYGIVLSIQWQGHFSYLRALGLVSSIGSKLADILSILHPNIQSIQPTYTMELFVHSMGHRVLQSALSKLSFKVPVTKFLSFAAEIEDIALAYPPFHNILPVGKSYHVWHDPTDKTLNMAALAHSGPRLGLTGPNPSFATDTNVYNIIGLNDYTTLAGKIFRHRYFYDSPTVKQQALLTLLA